RQTNPMSKTFEDTSIEEQKAWWLEQAQQALKSFEMTSAEIEWLAYTHNAVFQLQFKDSKYILRLSLPDNSSQINDEYQLLKTLLAADIQVSEPINLIQDENFSSILLSYLDGISPKPSHVTEDGMHQT